MRFQISNPDRFRNNIREKIAGIVQADRETEEALYKNIEMSIYNFTIKEATKRNIVRKWDNPSFVHIYMDRLRSVYMNIKNPALLHRIKSGEIPATNVAFLSHYEMNPVKWKEVLDLKMMRDASKLNQQIQASTDMYTCKRCKSKKTTYYEMATRSADEQMTIFITCLDCGKNWKQ